MEVWLPALVGVIWLLFVGASSCSKPLFSATTLSMMFFTASSWSPRSLAPPMMPSSRRKASTDRLFQRSMLPLFVTTLAAPAWVAKL